MSELRSDATALYVDHRGTLAARFWSKVDKNGPVPTHLPELGPCWVWTGSTDRKGYGQLGMGSKRDGSRRPVGAHRVSWLLATGSAPELCVLHKCDNPPCVRPDHLFAGTVAENNADMTAKGRHAPAPFTQETRKLATASLPRGAQHYANTNPDRLARGERHGNTRLTTEQVLALRAERAAGASLRVLADRYGIRECSVSAIAKRRNWRHVP